MMIKPNVALLLTGDELMNGDVIDSNSLLITEKLRELGLSVNKRVTIGDHLHSLSIEINQLTEQHDILLINGGLGPTIDDLTAQALAKSLKVELILQQGAHDHLIKWTNKRGIQLNQSNLKQAFLPSGCEIIDNPVGSAVGFQAQLNDCLIICTPGVPSELSIMLDTDINSLLKSAFPLTETPEVSKLQTFGIGESGLQELINQEFPNWPDEIVIGFRASMPIVELKLITNCQQGQKILPLWQSKLQKILGEHVITRSGGVKHLLAKTLVQQLTEKNVKITTAESCTGGMIASQITHIAGASAVFEAGYVTYSNEIKHKTLMVPLSTLDAHGAVSEETVIAMAKGALKASNADIAIAVSGIAGPSGGSIEKPVGTVWVAWGSSQQMHATQFNIKGTREYFQQLVTARCLDLTRRMLIKSNEKPYYLSQ